MQRSIHCLALAGLLIAQAAFATGCLRAAESETLETTATDWPAWRGAARTGIAEGQGIARKWPEGGPPLAWRVSGMGQGFSTPSVVAGRIYLMGNRGGEELVLCLDADQGRELWATSLGPVRHDGAGYPGPRSTPTFDESRIYVLGMNGDLACLDADTGRTLWKKNLVTDFAGAIPNWGYSESVLVDGDFVICTPGGGDGTLIALDKQNGNPRWRSSATDGAGYASAVVGQIAGEKQYVQFTSSGLVGVAAADGRQLWRYDAPANGTANCSTPLVSGDRAFAASGYGTGGGLVQVRRDGSTFTADEVYFSSRMKNHHGGMILRDGYIYGSDDPGVLTCLDLASGDQRWRDRECGKASLVCVDGLLVVRSEAGRVSLVDATPEEFRLLGRFEQPDRSDAPSWPHPVVAGGKLLLRDQDLLLCYDLRDETAP